MPTTVNPLAANVGVEVIGQSAPDLVNRSAADDCLAWLHQYGVVV
jgi:hypothetical protein